MKMKILAKTTSLFHGIGRRVRNAYYRRTLHRCGERLQVDVDVNIINPHKISVGNDVTLNRGVLLQGTQDAKIVIGNNVTFSYGARVITANLAFPEHKHIYEDVIIGNNVWVSAGVIILPGVIINDNVLIAAGAVVTSNLESDYVYGGIPAKPIKKIK